MLYIYIPDVDAAFARALAAGATVIRPVADQEYGHRSGGVLDTNGNQWWIASPIV
jgi:PhnB protein